MSGPLGAAVVAAGVAAIAAIFGFVVNRRSVAVVELEAAMKWLKSENEDLRAQLTEVRKDLRQANAHIEALQEELDQLRKKDR